MTSCSRGGGRADWCVTSAGIMFSSFCPVECSAGAKFDMVYVVVGIRSTTPEPGIAQPPAWLSIQMNIKEVDSMIVLDVTKDGQWLSHLRHHDDEHYTPTMKLHFAESLSQIPQYTKHTVYNSKLFKTPC